MNEAFIDHAMRGDSLHVINQANNIIDEYLEHGLTLTLRQLYYQFVARGLLDNVDRNYKRLGKIISKGREAGLVDWSAIEDRGRSATRVFGAETPEEALQDVEYGLVLNPWGDQGNYVEVWIEKDALIGTIERACDTFRVTRMACKGYLSSTAAYDAGRRFQAARRNGKRCILIHLGDHDPSGIDMTRDNQSRAELFSRSHVEIRRIALNMPQVREYNPPPNPAKITDSRAEDYIATHGYSSWELDALDPTVLDRLVRDEISDCITDQSAFDKTFRTENVKRLKLRMLSENWDDVSDFLDTL